MDKQKIKSVPRLTTDNPVDNFRRPSTSPTSARTTGCACRSKQEVTVEPKVQAKPKTIREKIAGILTGKK